MTVIWILLTFIERQESTTSTSTIELTQKLQMIISFSAFEKKKWKFQVKTSILKIYKIY